MSRRREQEPSGCLWVMILLGLIYAALALIWQEHQTAVLAIAGAIALIAALAWLLDAPRRRAAASEARRVAALTPRERDALREERQREVEQRQSEEEQALERRRQRRLSAEQAAKGAVRQQMRADGFGEPHLYEMIRVDEFAAGCEVVFHTRGEHGGLLEGTAYVWDDGERVDVTLGFAEPL